MIKYFFVPNKLDRYTLSALNAFEQECGRLGRYLSSCKFAGVERRK